MRIVLVDDIGDLETLYDLDDVGGWACEHGCDLNEEKSEGGLYECGDCGNVFIRENSPYGNHQCECGRFASKIADNACLACGEGTVEYVTAIECPWCEELVNKEELADHLSSCR